MDNLIYTQKERDELYRKSIKPRKTIEQEYTFLQERYMNLLEAYVTLAKKNNKIRREYGII